MKYSIVELFSGIGSQLKALKNLKFDINVQNTCEWDIHAFVAYDLIHQTNIIVNQDKELTRNEILKFLSKYELSNNGKAPMQYSSVERYNDDVLKQIYYAIKRTNNLVNIKNVHAKDMPPKTDILTYSFPCQDLSNVGAFHGYNKGINPDSGSRSSLLWQVGRILEEMKKEKRMLPKYLIMENVPTLLSDRHFYNFNKWILLLDSLGYRSRYFPLNAKDFGIPQNRPRLLMLSIFVGDSKRKKEKVLKYFKSVTPQSIVEDYCNSIFYNKKRVRDLLRIPKGKNSKFWEEAIESTPNDTPSRRKIWNENPKIIDENYNLMDDPFIRTLTTKQDRNPNSGNIYFDSGIKNKGSFRYLTPRECLLFMGFTDEDYENIIKNNIQKDKIHSFFSKDNIIKMAGNSIPVKLLEGFFYQLYKIEKILKN